jgi:Phage terminase large subunit gpA, ATPase domain
MARKPSFHEWLFAECDWKISSGQLKGARFTLDAFPCQLDIIRDQHPLIGIMKSAQVAISEQFTLQRPFYFMAVHRKNWGVLFPTQGDMRNFFKTRVKPAIAVNPLIQRNTTAINEGNVDAFGRALYQRYTTTETAIATFDADGVTVDEQDFHNQDTLYGARTSRTQGAMGETHWYDISTPSFPNFGIHQSNLNSDQRSWVIRCHHCSHENDLTVKFGPYDLQDIELFFREFLDRFDRWQDYFIPCSKCGRDIDPVSRFDSAKPSSGGGRWVAKLPSRDAHGYHLQIFQRLYDGGTPMVLKRVRNNLLAATKPHHVRRWWNTTIGVPYIGSEGRLGDEDLQNVTTHEYDSRWRRDILNDTVGLIDRHTVGWLGVDVRADQYHILGLSRVSRDRFLVSLVGWVPDRAVLWDLWKRLDEPVFVLDAMPDTNESRSIVSSMGRRARRGQFAKNTRALWQESAEDDLLIVSRPKSMESVKASIEGRNWIVPAPAWEMGSGNFATRGHDRVELLLRDHFKAPVMIREESDLSINEDYDFPKKAMQGVDPHFFMAACLALVGTEIQAAPASILVIPR